MYCIECTQPTTEKKRQMYRFQDIDALYHANNHNKCTETLKVHTTNRDGKSAVGSMHFQSYGTFINPIPRPQEYTRTTNRHRLEQLAVRTPIIRHLHYKSRTATSGVYAHYEPQLIEQLVVCTPIIRHLHQTYFPQKATILPISKRAGWSKRDSVCRISLPVNPQQRPPPPDFKT